MEGEDGRGEEIVFQILPGWGEGEGRLHGDLHLMGFSDSQAARRFDDGLFKRAGEKVE